MTYSGSITDSHGRPIPGAAAVFSNDAGQVIATIPVNSSGVWAIDTEFDDGLLQPGMRVQMTAPGYGSYGIDTVNLSAIFNVQLQKKQLQPWIIAAVAAAAGIVIYSKTEKGKTGKIDDDDIKTIFLLVGGVVGFTVIKKALEALNIWSSPEKKELNQLASDPNSFWSPSYWQKINPSNTGWSYALTEDQANALNDELIGNAFGIIYDSPGNALAVFKKVKTKANVSFMAWALQKNRGEDLLTLLRDGGGIFPWDGLSDANVLMISNYVNSLPNY